MNNQRIKTLFTDIGGVLLTNGWDHNSRAKAVEKFGLDAHETQERHSMTFDTYEVGKLTLHEYLERVVFYKERDFSFEDFRQFMFDQSQPYNDMLELIKGLKKKYNLKIAVVSNEGRELNEHRINTFKLNSFVDFFISSSFVHFRKPDVDIFKVAIDIAQVNPTETLYLEDRPMFVQVSETVGLKGVCHKDYESTKAIFASYGLTL
jgi:putative hydrolase of the HAD superfamily